MIVEIALKNKAFNNLCNNNKVCIEQGYVTKITSVLCLASECNSSVFNAQKSSSTMFSL